MSKAYFKDPDGLPLELYEEAIPNPSHAKE